MAMGCIYARFNTLWMKFTGPNGKVVYKSTGLKVGQEREARRVLKKAEDLVKRQDELSPSGPLTVASYGALWMDRRKVDVRSWEDDQSHLELHVYPTLGHLKVSEVRPRHLRELVLGLRATELAPRTVRNIYTTIRALFRDAVA